MGRNGMTFELDVKHESDRVAKILLADKRYCVSASGRIKLIREGYEGKLFVAFVGPYNYIWLPKVKMPTTLTIESFEKSSFSVYISEA
jgi:hypothetical protein